MVVTPSLFEYFCSTINFIILESRLPQAITAFLAGAGLAVSGLLLQTTFRNPLAGPTILGVSSGASLGVAIVMLFLGGSVTLGSGSLGGYMGVVGGALAGSFTIMGILILLSTISMCIKFPTYRILLFKSLLGELFQLYL